MRRAFLMGADELHQTFPAATEIVTLLKDGQKDEAIDRLMDLWRNDSFGLFMVAAALSSIVAQTIPASVIQEIALQAQGGLGG